MTNVTFQKRHYEFISKVVSDLKDELSEYDIDLIAKHFAIYLQRTNPNFDRERFIKACQRRE